jgi:hypothetical protein
MRQTIFSLCFLPLTVCLWAQSSSPNRTEKAAIQRTKNLIVSSLDSHLPNVSLEFFLQYEGGGVPIKWEVNDGGEETGNPATDRGRDFPMCVEADLDLKDRTAVAVLVAVGTFKKGFSGPLELFSVTITDASGASRIVPHLSDLPKELHRPVPPAPRDLPPPVARFFAPKCQRIEPTGGNCERSRGAQRYRGRASSYCFF